MLARKWNKFWKLSFTSSNQKCKIRDFELKLACNTVFDDRVFAAPPLPSALYSRPLSRSEENANCHSYLPDAVGGLGSDVGPSTKSWTVALRGL